MNGSYTKEYELSVVTPMESHGGKCKKGPLLEFRYPELKQSMVFWWRALQENPDKVADEEDRLFGSTQKKSPISFIPAEKQNKADIKMEEREQIIIKKNKDVQKVKVMIISQGSSVRFQLRGNCGEEDFKTYTAALELASYLGGLGKGSRKGKGAFYLKNIGEKNDYPQDASALQERIIQVMKSLGISGVTATQGSVVKKINIQLPDREDVVISKGSSKKNKYPRLLNIYIGKQISLNKFLERVADLPQKPKVNNEKILDQYAPHLILSAYPAQGNEMVYPVVSEFDCVLGECGSIAARKEAYEKYCKNFINITIWGNQVNVRRRTECRKN